MLNIDSKLAYFIAYERRTQWTIRRCIPPYSTRSPTHFPKSKHKITATPKKHLSLPSKKQKKSISQHKTKKGAPRRGERSNATLAGNSKTMKIRSRRRLLKTVDTQAKRQRRKKRVKSFRYKTRQASDSASTAALRAARSQ